MATKKKLVYNADGLIAGRLATIVAKNALLGYEIEIVNSEKAIITGSRKRVFSDYIHFLHIRTHYAPWKGPLHPRRPDRILRRLIRGMLPWDTSRGKNAYRRIRTHIGIPDELKSETFIAPEGAKFRGTNRRFVTIEEIAKNIGWTPRGAVV